MNREEAIKKLKELQNTDEWDVEQAHIEADNILCELLKTLGYSDVVEEWAKREKFFA